MKFNRHTDLFGQSFLLFINRKRIIVPEGIAISQTVGAMFFSGLTELNQIIDVGAGSILSINANRFAPWAMAASTASVIIFVTSLGVFFPRYFR